MNWINIKDEKPVWYTDIEIKVGAEIKTNRHRLTDGHTIYYGSLETDEIVYEKDVSHWRPIKIKIKNND